MAHETPTFAVILRRRCLLHKVPYYTTLAATQGLRAYKAGTLEVRALQDYFA